jgi:hypothetical protein
MKLGEMGGGHSLLGIRQGGKSHTDLTLRTEGIENHNLPAKGCWSKLARAGSKGWPTPTFRKLGLRRGRAAKQSAQPGYAYRIGGILEVSWRGTRKTGPAQLQAAAAARVRGYQRLCQARRPRPSPARCRGHVV